MIGPAGIWKVDKGTENIAANYPTSTHNGTLGRRIAPIFQRWDGNGINKMTIIHLLQYLTSDPFYTNTVLGAKS
jgi:hypothetical protein